MSIKQARDYAIKNNIDITLIEALYELYGKDYIDVYSKPSKNHVKKVKDLLKKWFNEGETDKYTFTLNTNKINLKENTMTEAKGFSTWLNEGGSIFGGKAVADAVASEGTEVKAAEPTNKETPENKIKAKDIAIKDSGVAKTTDVVLNQGKDIVATKPVKTMVGDEKVKPTTPRHTKKEIAHDKIQESKWNVMEGPQLALDESLNENVSKEIDKVDVRAEAEKVVEKEIKRLKGLRKKYKDNDELEDRIYYLEGLSGAIHHYEGDEY